MGVDGQTLGEEELVAGAYHTAVVQIDIVDEEPRADAVGLECAAFFEQLHVVLVEEQARLVFRVGRHVVGGAVPEVAEGAMLYLVESALAEPRLHTCHQVAPEGDLRAVEGRLFDDALGTIGDIRENHLVGLVGRITEEVALKYRLSPFQLALKQLVIGVEHGLQLLGVGEPLGIHMDHHLILFHLRAVVEAGDVGRCVLKDYV